MRYLLISSLCLLSACASQYKHLQQSSGDAGCLQKFKPDFTRALYYTTVNVTGKYLSGILLIKKMPDSSTRMVFSNQSGFKFFDFEYNAAGDFKVYQVIDQLNKKPVLITLRKDFEIVMMHDKVMQNGFIKTDSSGLKYYGFPAEKGYNYYITDANCNELVRMERASSRKAVVRAIMKDYKNGIPDTIGISHIGFQFDIGLKRLEDAPNP